MPHRFALIAVKLVHTLAWAVFAGCILAIPVYAWRRELGVAAWLIGIVMVEVVVLAANGMRCPLTAVAARYTPERQDNFDIYLPLWLARYNKQVFGSLFAGGLVFTLVRWWW
ncbi:MAG: hypothetical protein IPK85_00790 [Gemmatimonadetes bacterium]|nr:hypothetical protein [Gemmatimonadota bacterium]